MATTQALQFTGGDTDIVNHGTLGSLDLDGHTVVALAYLDSIDVNTVLWAKADPNTPFTRIEYQFRNTNTFRLRITGSTVLLYTANNSTLTTGGWYVLSCAYDSGGGAGSLISAYTCPWGSGSATAVSWASTNDGATLDAHTAHDFTAGNKAADSFPGRIAKIGVYPSVLTEANVETLAQQDDWDILSAVLASDYDSATSCSDLTGNGHTGTVTGATLANGPDPSGSSGRGTGRGIGRGVGRAVHRSMEKINGLWRASGPRILVPVGISF